MQVVNKKLKDTKGGYSQFLRENVGEAKVMEEKEKRVKVLEQSTVKAKSKVGLAPLYLLHPCWLFCTLPACDMCLLPRGCARDVTYMHCGGGRRICHMPL